MGVYSHYDGAHNHPVNRALHLIAIPVGFSSIIVVWLHWIVALLLIPTAFALAWLGHLIEGNKPEFLTNPVHVLCRAAVDGETNFWQTRGEECLTIKSSRY
jgi:hypothetical protein